MTTASGTWVCETGYTGTPSVAVSGETDGTRLSLFTYDLMDRQLTQNDYAGGMSAVYSRATTHNVSCAMSV